MFFVLYKYIPSSQTRKHPAKHLCKDVFCLINTASYSNGIQTHNHLVCNPQP